MFGESITLIPLIITFLASLYFLILLISLIRKQKDNFPKSIIAAPVVLIVGVLVAIIKPDIAIVSITLTLSTLLIIPYFRNLKNEDKEKSQGIDVLTTPDAPDPEEEAEKAEKAFFESNLSLLTAGRDYVFHAGQAFSEEGGLARLLDFINTSLIRETKADGGAVLLIDDFDDVISVKSFSGDFPPPYKLPEDLPHKVVRVETSFRFAQFGLNENIFGRRNRY